MSNVARILTRIGNKEFAKLNAFSITTDAWTDTRMRKYIAITYHAIHPEEFRFISITRDILHVPLSHTWDVVCHTIRKQIQSHFPHDATLACVTTDNGSNFVKMSIALLSTLGVEELNRIGVNSWDEQVTPPTDLEDYGWRCVVYFSFLCFSL
jgi:hypothetical protein